MGFSKKAPGQGIQTFIAEATITDGSVVVQGAADDKCKLPTGAAADLAVLGLAKVEGGGSVASGQGLDVVTNGVYTAKASGAVARGDRLCVANASGDVKKAGLGVPAAAVVGYALETAASGERVAVLVCPGAHPNLLIEAFVAEGAITANTAVKVGTADNKVATATADPTSGLVGVAMHTVADGATVYVCVGGVVPVVSQANITRGQNVTIGDASGGIKPAAPAAGANAQLLGTATASATAPATANVLVRVNMMQG